MRHVYMHPLPVPGQPRRPLKPLNIGMNHAKRVARSADRRDQLAVLRELGPGYPRQHNHHQELVRLRHAYYTGRA